MTLEEVREKAKKQEYVYYIYNDRVNAIKINHFAVFYIGGEESVSVKDRDDDYSIDMKDLFPTEQMAREENAKRIRNYAIERVKNLMQEHHILINEIAEGEE